MSYSVCDFGTAGDGATFDSPAIQKAVDACHAAGGGTVVVPAGRYRCGTIVLRANVCLHLESGAVIAASRQREDYDPIERGAGDVQGRKGYAVLAAHKADNVAVTGLGVIDGGGNEALRHPRAAEIFRPAMVYFDGCRNVRFEGVTFLYPSQWTVHLIRCHDVLIRGITILAHMDRINTDGIDPDGCRNVVISDCVIRTGDDSIVIKDTQGEGCANIAVSNCVLSSSCAALKIGTEALGDIRNVTFSNCVIENTNVALALYQKDGSTYENILFTNMIVESYAQFPIMLDITPRDFQHPTPGRIRTVSFDNVTVRSPGRVYMEGLPGYPIENVSFANLTWTITGALKTQDAQKPPGARRVVKDPERVNHAGHPYLFTCVHAASVRIRDVTVFDEQATPDRGMFYFNHVRGATVQGIRPAAPVAGIDPVRCATCDDVCIEGP